MDDNFDIDIQQLSVEDRNKFILGHFVHTWRGRISDDTLYQHVLNIEYFMDSYLSYCVVGVHDEPRSVDQVSGYDVYDFFTDYLVYYEPLKRLDEAGDDDVFTFLSSWFPRKAMWANETNVKSYLASFKKSFKWMGETERISDETVIEVLDTLKENREEFLEAVDDDLSDVW